MLLGRRVVAYVIRLLSCHAPLVELWQPAVKRRPRAPSSALASRAERRNSAAAAGPRALKLRAISIAAVVRCRTWFGLSAPPLLDDPQHLPTAPGDVGRQQQLGVGLVVHLAVLRLVVRMLGG